MAPLRILEAALYNKTRGQVCYKDLNTQQKLHKVEELIKKSGVTANEVYKSKIPTEAAIKASFVVAQEIVNSACPFPEGQFIIRTQ